MLAALLKIIAFINELLPIAQIAVTSVQAQAPAGTTGSDKFAAAHKAVSDTINATSAAEGAFTQTKAALASGDAESVGTAIGHSIEVALSVSKTFGLFPKAAIVQSAAPLPAGAADADAPGG